MLLLFFVVVVVVVVVIVTSLWNLLFMTLYYIPILQLDA